MKRGLFVTVASLLLFTIAGFTQEVRNEVSLQGTGFFTKRQQRQRNLTEYNEDGRTASGIPL